MASKTLIYFPTVRMIGRCYNQLHLDNMTAQVCVYHGSLSKEEKQENYEKFRTGEKLVMLATKAFGMGVDISDIAIVAHFAPTGNVCDYVQEIGRAARDPGLQGEAYYQYNTHDFKHINTLHGLSRIQKYQLIEVIRKIDELYTAYRKAHRDDFTRKRNAMLLDAENFSYIFQSPLEDQQDESINKVKTALLMIQKDFEGKYSYPALAVRPIPLFEEGFFQAEPATQKRLTQEYGECLQEVDRKRHICVFQLGRIWENDPENRKFSFPQFKYLLYTRSDELEMNRKHTLTPALFVTLEKKEKGRYDRIVSSLKAFINKRTIDGRHTGIDEMAEAIRTENPDLKRITARTICEVFIASMQTWQRKFTRGIHPAITAHPEISGRTKYSFNVFINSYFGWLDRMYHRVQEESMYRETAEDGTEISELYLVNDGGSLIQETANVLGVLDAVGELSFNMVGGANSQIYIYINQIQTLKNILKHPERYENRLLDMVAERHTVSVQMLTYLYGNDFTSEQRWDLLEDYFLGKIPEKVRKAVEREKTKKTKASEWEE